MHPGEVYRILLVAMIAKQTHNFIQQISRCLIGLLLLAGLGIGLMAAVYSTEASAQTQIEGSGGSSSGVNGTTGAEKTCGGVDTSIISCTEPGGEGSTIEQSGVWGVLKLAIQILSVGVGVLAVGGLLWGSILYASAGGGAEQTKKAKDIIKNVVIGLLLYIFMFAIVNFLVPGGILV